jgi:hypothetical protein
MAKSRKKGRSQRKILRIPDLEHSKHAAISSLPAKTSQNSYEYAKNEFISWYCSVLRLTPRARLVKKLSRAASG